MLFYRAHWMAQNLAPIDALVRAARGPRRQCPPDLLLQPEGRPRPGGGRPRRLPRVPDRRGRRSARVDVLDQHPQLHRRAPERGDAHRGVGGRRRPARAARRPGAPGGALHVELGRMGGQRRRPDPARHGDERRPARVRRPASTPSPSASRRRGRFDERLGTAIKAYVPKPDRVDYRRRGSRLELRPAPSHAERREARRDPLRQLSDQERPDRQRRGPRHARLGDEPAPGPARRRLHRRATSRPTATP